jgi:hypothetical protein
MGLPDVYSQKTGSFPAYFNAILKAGPPERFSTKFLEGLDFKSTNDRAIIGILKELKFLDADAKPTGRYFRFLDRENSKYVLAEAIRETYAELFTLNTEANKFTAEEAFNKLRTLYKGQKKDNLVKLIARTYTALCEYADFTPAPLIDSSLAEDSNSPQPLVEKSVANPSSPVGPSKAISLGALQYHINIVLPESRDQGVYDAIFKSLRDHLG